MLKTTHFCRCALTQLSRFRILSTVLLAIVLAVFSNTAEADLIPVFFAGGQSNAKPDWATSIQDELRTSYDPAAVVVNNRHNGNWLYSWSDDGVMQANYQADSAAIQSTLERIISEGNTPDFQGIFWFQGESDSGGKFAVLRYEKRFKDMIDAYERDFETDIFTTIMVMDMDPAYPRPTPFSQDRIDQLRAIQFGLGEDSMMTSLDSRGYGRYDAWHLTTSEQQRLGKNAALAFVSATAVPEPSLFSPLLFTLVCFVTKRRR